MSRTVIGALVTTAVLAACGTASSQTQPAARPAKASPADTFTATARGVRGKVTLVLTHAGGSRVVLSLRGALTGTLRGTLVEGPRGLPDVGRTYRIAASGRVKPLGHPVSATGTITGSGFVARGYERLALTLSRAHHRVALTGRSGAVPGFTSP